MAVYLLSEQVVLALDCVRQGLKMIEIALDNEDGSNNQSGYQAQVLPLGRPSFEHCEHPLEQTNISSISIYSQVAIHSYTSYTPIDIHFMQLTLIGAHS